MASGDAAKRHTVHKVSSPQQRIAQPKMSGMSGQNPQSEILGGYKEKSGTNAVERERELEEVSAHTHQQRFLGEALGKSSDILAEYYDIAGIQL